MRLCLGYYARGGFSGWTRKEQDIEPLSVEITDTGRWRMRHGDKLDAVCQSLFPKPIRFREVWKQVGRLFVVASSPTGSLYFLLASDRCCNQHSFHS